MKKLYSEPSITAAARSQRIRWLDHVWRMDTQRVGKSVITKSIGGKPRESWVSEVESDLRSLGVTEWRKEAVNRK